MKNILKHSVMPLMLAMGLIGTKSLAYAESDIKVFADIGTYSQYLWRNVPQGGGEFSVQGDVGLELGDGLSVSAWFATGVGTDTEYDLTLDYSGESDGIAYSIGFYTINYIDTPANNGGEFYASVAYDVASATIYVAETYTYYEIGAEYGLDVVDASILAGYDDAAQKSDVTLGLSKTYEMSSYTLTPSFVVGKLQGADAEFVVGVKASF